MKALFFFFIASGLLPAAVSNSVTIRNLTGSPMTNRPITVSRVFAEGEIAQFAQARVGGAAVLTQCDVKTRWADGSLKHALVSFRADLPGSGSIMVDFINQGTGNNTGHLTSTAQMLAPSWMTGSPPWNAELEINGGTGPIVKNVRTMLGRLALAPGQVRYWMQGPIVTQVIVEDRTSVRSEDFGLDANKSLHPIFVLTFYNGWNSVKVEYIVENMWSTKLQDQTYSLTLKAGVALASVHTKAAFTHFQKTRWRKVFWSGQDLDGAPQSRNIHIDLNQAYLSYSRAILNYDPKYRPTDAAIAGALNGFNGTDKGDINGNGQINKYFPMTGGRSEIGPYPTWETRYLTTFDPRLYDVVLGNGSVSAHVPIHRRESDPAFGADFGSIYTIKNHPTNTPASLSPSGAHGWTVDQSHQPAFGFVPYLITGDWYWIEEMQAWAAANAGWGDPGTCSYCRNGAMGIITEPNQPRGLAWGIRNLAHAVYFTPDDDPQKPVYAQFLDNNLGAYEGELDITDSVYYNTPQWLFGRNVMAPNLAGGGVGGLPNPLGFIMYNAYGGDISPYADTTKVSYIDAPWTVHYLRVALGRLVELGFPAQKLLDRISGELIHSVLDPAIGNPYIVGAYTAPRTAAGTKKWFQTWAAYAAGYNPQYLAIRTWEGLASGSGDNNADNGYSQIARAAASFTTHVVDGPFTGQAAYDWLDANVNKSVLMSNPKWAIVPRTSGQVSVTSPCDVNRDGQTNVTDVQLSLNGAIGSGPASVDLDQNGRTDVVDVQRVTNAALGGSCRVGP